MGVSAIAPYGLDLKAALEVGTLILSPDTGQQGQMEECPALEFVEHGNKKPRH